MCKTGLAKQLYIHTLQHYEALQKAWGTLPSLSPQPLLSVHDEDSIYEEWTPRFTVKRKAKQSLLLLSKKDSVYEVDNMDLFLFS